MIFGFNLDVKRHGGRDTPESRWTRSWRSQGTNKAGGIGVLCLGNRAPVLHMRKA